MVKKLPDSTKEIKRFYKDEISKLKKRIQELEQIIKKHNKQPFKKKTKDDIIEEMKKRFKSVKEIQK
jgi:hypothetical protein